MMITSAACFFIDSQGLCLISLCLLLQVLESIERSYGSKQSQESLQQVSSHFREALSLDNLEHVNDTKVWELACLKHIMASHLFSS